MGKGQNLTPKVLKCAGCELEEGSGVAQPEEDGAPHLGRFCAADQGGAKGPHRGGVPSFLL